MENIYFGINLKETATGVSNFFFEGRYLIEESRLSNVSWG